MPTRARDTKTNRTSTFEFSLIRSSHVYERIVVVRVVVVATAR